MQPGSTVTQDPARGNGDAAGGAPHGLLTVYCTNVGCSASGVRKQIRLAEIAPGVLSRPQLLCAACGFHVYEEATRA